MRVCLFLSSNGTAEEPETPHEMSRGNEILESEYIEYMRRRMIVLALLLCCLWVSVGMHAQSSLIPTTAISNMPVITISDMNLDRNDYTILNSITATAVVRSDNRKSKRTIFEENNEFKLVYDIVKSDGKRYLEYDDCEGVIRLGYIGGTNIYNSDSNYIPAEEIVRRLALYRLIGLAKQYGADALFEPTITTTATSEGKLLVYRTEASAKLIKITND